MESQPQNTELRNNPENFHPCSLYKNITGSLNKDVLQFLNLVLPQQTVPT